MTAPARTLITAITLDGCVAGQDSAGVGRIAARSDEAGVDLLILGPAGLRLDPLILAGWLAPLIGRAGLVARVPALSALPFHVARALSALDFLTRGRGGWSPATLGHDAQAARIGDPARVAPDQALAKAADFVEATCALWDSWDADALIIDKASGVYLNADRVRRVDYRGPYFQVMGPLNAARPPQGHPLLVQSDADPLWRRLAGRTDVLLAADAAELAVRRAEIGQAGGKARMLASLTLDGRASDAVADQLATWFKAGLIDGVHLAPNGSGALEAVIGDLMPTLARRGLIGRAPVSATLRSRFGLAAPEPAPALLAAGV